MSENQVDVQNVDIHPSWLTVLKTEFQQPYFTQLKQSLKKEKQEFTVYPKGKDIFNAFNSTPFEQVKAVILGQDPYHGPNQAHGLSFSVQQGIRIPPSLKNMHKELKDDLGFDIPNHGNLQSWATNGVLMLNAMLTVRASQPGSHSKLGWQQFTDAVIKAVSKEKENITFLLWGNFAGSKAEFIDESKHLVLKSAHPSPFSAHRGFFGSRPYSKVNEYLVKHGKQPINWQIDSL